MSELTSKRLMTDETGEEIVQALEDLADAVKPDATNIDMGPSDSTTVAEAIGALNSNLDKLQASESTGDILSSATSATKTTIFKGNGSSYTGTLPSAIYRYGVFIVTPRDNNRIVQAVADGAYAVNYYNGSVWNGWQEFALNSNLATKAKHIVLESGDNTWAKIWAKINTLSNLETATFYSSYQATTVWGGGVKSVAIQGTISRVSASQFEIIGKYATNNLVCIRLTDVSSSSAGTYSENDITSKLSNLSNVSFKDVSNVNNFTVDLGYTPSASKYGQLIVFNSNQGSLNMISVGNATNIVKVFGNITLTASLSGQNITVEASGTLWGSTIVMISHN